MNEGKHVRHNTGQFSCTVTEERLELGQVVHFAVGVLNVYEYTKNFDDLSYLVLPNRPKYLEIQGVKHGKRGVLFLGWLQPKNSFEPIFMAISRYRTTVAAYMNCPEDFSTRASRCPRLRRWKTGMLGADFMEH